MTTTHTNPFASTTIADEPGPALPTTAQVNYLRKLAEDVHGENAPEWLLAVEQGDAYTKRGVSILIDTLKKTPAIEAHRAGPRRSTTPEGFHFLGGVVYKVQSNRAGTALYAKKLDAEHGFEYVGTSPLRFLSDETLLTYEQAAEYGKLYGVCARCGATLTDEESIARGIGPICAEKF